MSVVDDVKVYITEKFATEITSEELPSDVDLLATGILTSVSTVQLLGWCGRNFKIPINSISINPDDLKTPEDIAHFIESYRTDTTS